MNRLLLGIVLILVAGLIAFQKIGAGAGNRLLWGIKLSWFHSLLYRLTGRVLVATIDTRTGQRLNLYWDDGAKFVAGGEL